MSHKTAKISAIIELFQGQDLDPHYLGFFECFNHQLFFEAHEVLEELWLTERGGPKALFYKGLIQLAGAFVHVQKKRPQPAIALFKLAQSSLSRYPALQDRLDLDEVRRIIEAWLLKLPSDGCRGNLLSVANAPRLVLAE